MFLSIKFLLFKSSMQACTFLLSLSLFESPVKLSFSIYSSTTNSKNTLKRTEVELGKSDTSNF